MRVFVLMGFSFVLSAFAGESKVDEDVQESLCQLVKEDNDTRMIGYLNTSDIRLYNNYREIYCKAEVGFSGGSLLKTADHFGAQRVFDKLVQNIKVDDIFWEHPVNNNIRNTKIMAYKK